MTRRLALAVLATLGLLVVGAGPVRAQFVDVVPTAVQAGATVSITGVRGFASGPAVEVRLDDADGPVLAASPTAAGGFGALDVVIPADTKAGPHVLLISQALRRTDTGARLPVRAAITVTGPGGLAVRGVDPRALLPVTGLPAQPVVEKGPGPEAGSLVLVGLGVAALALIVAVPIALAAGRRTPAVPA